MYIVVRGNKTDTGSFICEIGSQFYHQMLIVEQYNYSSNLYKTSYDHFKTLHEILGSPINACSSLFLWFSFDLVFPN